MSDHVTSYFADLTLSELSKLEQVESLQSNQGDHARLNCSEKFEVESQLSQSDLNFLEYYQQFARQISSETQSLWRTPNQFSIPHQNLISRIWSHPATKIGIVGVAGLAVMQVATSPAQSKRQVTPTKPSSAKAQNVVSAKPALPKFLMVEAPRPTIEFSSRPTVTARLRAETQLKSPSPKSSMSQPKSKLF